jgi:hypothetical protein
MRRPTTTSASSGRFQSLKKENDEIEFFQGGARFTNRVLSGEPIVHQL